MPETIDENGDCAPDTKVSDPEKKAEITYDDFAKIEFRVGKILHAEEVKKSKKLLKFTLDDGTVVYVDPFAGAGYDLPADLILVTHERAIAEHAPRILHIADGMIAQDERR